MMFFNLELDGEVQNIAQDTVSVNKSPERQKPHDLRRSNTPQPGSRKTPSPQSSPSIDIPRRTTSPNKQALESFKLAPTYQYPNEIPDIKVFKQGFHERHRTRHIRTARRNRHRGRITQSDTDIATKDTWNETTDLSQSVPNPINLIFYYQNHVDRSNAYNEQSSQPEPASQHCSCLP